MSRYTRRGVPILLGALVLVLAGTAATPATAGGTAIEQAYSKLGGTASGIGAPTGEETCGLRGGGCYRSYEHGAIVWTPETGAQPTWGTIREAWAGSSYENGALGYPVAAPACTGGTCAQQFERGSISWRAGKGATPKLDIDDAASTAVVVNKARPLVPAEYIPQDLTSVDGQLLRADAAEALQILRQAAAADGVGMTAVSGYRPFTEQAGLYSGYIAQYGQDQADGISARPGYSEHQTGLAVDMAAPDGQCTLQACFEDTAAGAWIAENAQRFGFIVRYPANAAAVTGYAYEPWHLRFVGADIAGGMHEAGSATLEEYLDLPAAPAY